MAARLAAIRIMHGWRQSRAWAVPCLVATPTERAGRQKGPYADARRFCRVSSLFTYFTQSRVFREHNSPTSAGIAPPATRDPALPRDDLNA